MPQLECVRGLQEGRRRGRSAGAIGEGKLLSRRTVASWGRKVSRARSDPFGEPRYTKLQKKKKNSRVGTQGGGVALVQQQSS